jgi:hypothetical protein
MTDLAKLGAGWTRLKQGTLWNSTGKCRGYAVANPAEASILDQYVLAVAAGGTPPMPTLATATAQMVAAAIASVSPPPPPPGYLFQDEFDGPAGSPPDASKWWVTPWCSTSSDDSMGCYNPKNAFLDGNGHLVLRVSPGTMGRTYDFARVQTFQEGGWPPPKVLKAFGPGTRWEASIKFGAGAGVWGGFWPMGTDVAPPVEIDIEEFRGAFPNQVSCHTHLGSASAGLPVLDAAVDLTAGFHRYWIEYGATSTKFGFDDKTLGSLPTPSQKLGIRLSNAVGPPGTWGGQNGPPPASAIPSAMLVDYVHVVALA